MAELRVGWQLYIALLLALTAAMGSAPPFRRAMAAWPAPEGAMSAGTMLAGAGDAAEEIAAVEAGLAPSAPVDR